MISFGFFLYRNAHAANGGPILAVARSGTISVLGSLHVQVNAFLKPELKKGACHNAVFGDCDGTGSSTDPAVAEQKAISEALERWAFYDCHSPERPLGFGFDQDPSSNGMAAFPGFRWQARALAQSEALERWAVISWWTGQLEAESIPCPEYPQLEVFRINHGRKGDVVILHQQSNRGFHTYGHAAGETVEDAINKAAVELARNEVAIARHRSRAVLNAESSGPESRALYFSTPDGYRHFQERLNSKSDKAAPPWTVVFDGPVPGPWTKWASVWRCCVEMPTYDFLHNDEKIFFW